MVARSPANALTSIPGQKTLETAGKHMQTMRNKHQPLQTPLVSKAFTTECKHSYVSKVFTMGGSDSTRVQGLHYGMQAFLRVQGLHYGSRSNERE